MLHEKYTINCFVKIAILSTMVWMGDMLGELLVMCGWCTFAQSLMFLEGLAIVVLLCLIKTALNRLLILTVSETIL